MRFSALFRKGRLERDLDDEVRSHLEMLEDEFVRQGMTRDRARFEARRAFGGIEKTKEAYRDRRGLPLIETFLQDLRYAVRMLRRAPGFTTVAIVSLALGIGANAAVFTLINAVMLRTLPVPDPHRLVVFNGRYRADPGFVSFPMYRDIRARQQVFTDILASAGETPVRLTVPGGAAIDNIRVSFVTANYFPVLGILPAIGRFFTAEEDRDAGRAEALGSVAVLSDSFWERQFGRDPEVLGRTVSVNRAVCKVIGVAPRTFTGEALEGSPDLWVPLVRFSSNANLENREGMFTHYMARLKPGVSHEQAEAAVTILYRQLLREERIETPPGVPKTPKKVEDFRLDLDHGATGIAYFLRKRFGKPLWIVMAVVALVLVISCANVANLLLARAVGRRRELTLRLALGCARRRLIRQLLTESLLLSSAGALVGLALGHWGSRALLAMVDIGPSRSPVDPRVDAVVLAFLAGIAVLSAIAFGIAPALRATPVDLAPALNEQARGFAGGRQRRLLSRNLVAAQIALSLLLLVGAGLLTRSLGNLHSIELGFRPENVLIFDLAHNARDRTPAAMARVSREVWDRVRQVPGVRSASLSGLLLFSPSDVGVFVKSPAASGSTRFNSVSPGYFETVGMDLIAGRDLSLNDAETAPSVAVVNESLARVHFPGGAVGRAIEVGAVPPARQVEIVGVVRDAKYNDLRAETRPMVYFPIAQLPRSLRSLEVRTSIPANAVAGPVRQALLEVSRDIMVRRVIPLSEQVNSTLRAERMVATLCMVFAALALLLASVGMYGVISYGVAQRTNEIGIRMALGASRKTVVGMVVRESALVVTAGVVLGLWLSWAATRLLTNMLYGVRPTDPLTLMAATLSLVAVAAIAAYMPALRASRVEPVIALRHE